MTTTKAQTLETAEAERDRLASAARAAGEVADALAAERLALLTERRQDWAHAVLATGANVAATLTKSERDAAATFRIAAVNGDPREAFLSWIDTRNESNLHRDRVVQARAFLGDAQDDAGYVFRDVPSYSAELDRALGAEASERFADRQGDLQRELNALDVLP